MFKSAEKSFSKQTYQSWCGLACLSMISKYYGGHVSQERLVNLSGTSTTGTTLLGLYQAANAIGLKAEGFESNMEELKRLKCPAILHFTLENGWEHYVTFFGFENGTFIIGDPAKEVLIMSPEAVAKQWRSKKLLLVQKGEHFQTKKEAQSQKYSWIKELLKPDIPILCIISCIGIIIAGVSISLAVFSQYLIDKVIPLESHEKLWIAITILFLLMLIRNVLSYFRIKIVARQSKRFANRIVGSFYNLILYLPKSFFDSLKTGEITARLNDASRIQRAINYVVGTLLVDVLTVVICVILLLNYWWLVGVLSLAGGLVFGLIFGLYGKRIVAGQRKVMVDYAGAESNFFDTVQGAEVIKENNKEEFFTQYTKRIYADFQNSVYDLTLLGNRISFTIQNIGTIVSVGVITFSASAVLDNFLSLGVLVAILSLTSSVMASSASMSSAYITLQESKVAYNRLDEFICLDKEDIATTSAESLDQINKLDVCDICFRFPGRPLLLEKLCFTAQKGKLTVILGEIGVGKSTLLYILERFYKLESGTVFIDNRNWTDFSVYDWRTNVSTMPQHIKLFNTNILGNICLADEKLVQQQCLDFCEQLGVLKYFANLPMGLFTRVGEDGISLSGGQRQLVGLCRALFSAPKILLLDEPTNNMDRATIQFVWELLEREKHHRICILVTHNDQLSSKADSIISI